MVERNTKKRILEAAILLANDRGFGTIPLQLIASEVGMSTGNLAYHFRNKEAIAQGLQDEVEEHLQDILKTYRLFPNLLDFDHQLNKYFEFFEAYPFFFRDQLEFERLLPESASDRQDWVEKIIQQFQQRLAFNVQRGVIRPACQTAEFEELAVCIWSQILGWPGLRLTGTVDNQPEVFKSHIWRVIQPLFTKQGLAEYEMLIVPILSKSSS